jgi:hypothetical protein
LKALEGPGFPVDEIQNVQSSATVSGEDVSKVLGLNDPDAAHQFDADFRSALTVIR